MVRLPSISCEMRSSTVRMATQNTRASQALLMNPRVQKVCLGSPCCWAASLRDRRRICNRVLGSIVCTSTKSHHQIAFAYLHFNILVIIRDLNHLLAPSIAQRARFGSPTSGGDCSDVAHAFDIFILTGLQTSLCTLQRWPIDYTTSTGAVSP